MRKQLIALPLLASLILSAALMSAPLPAGALCAAPQEAGSWSNTDPATRSIPQMEVRHVCKDQILNGEPYPPGPDWYLHLFGACHPTNCDWGEIGAQKLSSGHIYALYDQGFAKRHVFIRMSQYRQGQLWVYISTDFTDPNRADYTSQDWFTRR
jgi:hypothetical protein